MEMTQPIFSDHPVGREAQVSRRTVLGLEAWQGGRRNEGRGPSLAAETAANYGALVRTLDGVLGKWIGGQMPTRRLVQVLVVPAYLCFLIGVCLSLVNLPVEFDYGACVISRLCSNIYNPDGFQYLALGMSAMAVLLLPVPSWMSYRYVGCHRLCAWGRTTMHLGLTATIGIGVERAWCPTHWTCFELIHLTLAATAFLCLWLGMAMFAGAAGPSGAPRVRWSWLWRPPWFLAACALPIIMVFGMSLPLNVVPEVRNWLFAAMPRGLIFLRTVTFWQWYLVFGLLLSLGASVGRTCRLERRLGATPGAWRLDPPQAASSHILLDDRVAET
jgi:hypothetical protein